MSRLVRIEKRTARSPASLAALSTYDRAHFSLNFMIMPAKAGFFSKLRGGSYV